MKKIYVMVLAVFLTAGALNAQSNYLRFGVGGGVGLKQYMGNLWSDQTVTNTADNVVVKSFGLGSGFNVNLAFGHMLSDNIGIELGVNEFIGLTKKTHYSENNNYGDYSSDTKLSGMMLQLVPAILITPGLEKINPYARLGMIVGILSSVTEKYDANGNYGGELKATHTTTDKIKLSGGVAIGFTAAGGVDYNLGEKLGLYAELVFNGITYAPKKGKYKEWTEDGVDVLGSKTTKEKEWTFEKKYDIDENIPDGSPDKQPKMSLNFSNVLLNIGIKFKL
jgi:hypothetical protein